ncbi:MAG: hypothetical protein ACKO2Q_09630 [Actinomycetota bacterium]
MTHPDPTIRISASAFRQLLSAAADAGLANIISASSVRNLGDQVFIKITARELRALTDWLVKVAESHATAPIVAGSGSTGGTSGDSDNASWMRDITDTVRVAPVGYETVNVPKQKKGTTK